MAKLLAKSIKEKDEIKTLINKKLPTHRQAYSDRTAWVMSCISEISYIRFNPYLPNLKQKDYFLKNLRSLLKDDGKSSLGKIIDLVGYNSEKEQEELEANLDLLELDLVDTFDCEGTQAILVANADYVILAFRGTEATSLNDIKSDANAISVACESNGNIHKGFKDAYDLVALDIQERLNKGDLVNKPLYITGHSLGGALANIATKKLDHKAGIAACYTFGSPRVGDEVWISDIKTPIYRVVNAADCVTMLPPGDETVSIIAWIIQFIPYVGKTLEKTLLSKFTGYLHGGDMRYLCNCNNGKYSEARLLYSVSLFYRLKRLFNKKFPWKKPLADHSISIYRQKLMFIAKRRNQ